MLTLAVSTFAQEQEMATKNNLQDYNKDYIEELGGQIHDQIILKTSDGRTFWKGQTIPGWYIGAVAGANQSGQLFVVQAGYGQNKLFYFNLNIRYSQLDFQGNKEMVPSAFFDAEFNLVKFGKNKLETNRLYLGPRIGYQSAKAIYGVSGSGEGYEFNFQNEQDGSGFAYGLVAGWESRKFMNGNRFGIKLAAYTYDVSFKSNINGDKIVKNDQEFAFEVTFSYKFVFQKKANNYGKNR
jgi:hypothetical protein